MFCRMGDLREECGAQEALTWVENLHSGVGVWVLFMDHLSADLLRKNLPRDRNGIEVINIGCNNNRETNRTVFTQSCECVLQSRGILLNNCQIKCLQVVRRKHYYFNKLFKFCGQMMKKTFGERPV